jgi:uncharacterized membrane protein
MMLISYYYSFEEKVTFYALHFQETYIVRYPLYKISAGTVLLIVYKCTVLGNTK